MHRALDGAIERAAARGTSADLIDLGTLDLGFANGTPPADLEDDTAATIAAIASAGLRSQAASSSSSRCRRP